MAPTRWAAPAIAAMAATLLLSAQPVAAAEGKFPFFPSLINSRTGQPVPTSGYEEPEMGRPCHTEIYQQWKGSMHSTAFVDPVFVAMWKLGEKESNGAV